MAKSTHYVANIRITRVDHVDQPSATSRSIPGDRKRIVTEAASITVKGSDLAALKDRVASHLALVEDFADIDGVAE